MSQISRSKSMNHLKIFRSKYSNMKCRNLQKALWKSQQAVLLLVGLRMLLETMPGEQEKESKLHLLNYCLTQKKYKVTKSSPKLEANRRQEFLEV